MTSSSDNAPSKKPAPLAPEDFYYEGQYLVFTEAYHRKRGYCCQSNCRHCPYREAAGAPVPPANP